MPTCGWSITTWKGKSLVNSFLISSPVGENSLERVYFVWVYKTPLRFSERLCCGFQKRCSSWGRRGEGLHGWNSVWPGPWVPCPLLQGPRGHPALQEGPAPSSAVHQRLPRARLRGAAHPREDRRYLGAGRGWLSDKRSHRVTGRRWLIGWQKGTKWLAEGNELLHLLASLVRQRWHTGFWARVLCSTEVSLSSRCCQIHRQLSSSLLFWNDWIFPCLFGVLHYKWEVSALLGSWVFFFYLAGQLL